MYGAVSEVAFKDSQLSAAQDVWICGETVHRFDIPPPMVSLAETKYHH
jgi:hypothetical protein